MAVIWLGGFNMCAQIRSNRFQACLSPIAEGYCQFYRPFVSSQGLETLAGYTSVRGAKPRVSRLRHTDNAAAQCVSKSRRLLLAESNKNFSLS